MSEVYEQLVRRKEILRQRLFTIPPGTEEWSRVCVFLADVESAIDEVRDAVSRAIKVLIPNV